MQVHILHLTDMFLTSPLTVNSPSFSFPLQFICGRNEAICPSVFHSLDFADYILVCLLTCSILSTMLPYKPVVESRDSIRFRFNLLGGILHAW